jgi:hypothetical protein
VGQALVAAAPTDWSAASEAELDEVDRVCAAIVTAARREAWARAGWRESANWDARGPGVTRLRGGAWSIRGADAPYLDHGYRLLHQASGRALYVSEPYSLGEEALAALDQLRRAGWRVCVRGWGTRYFPGHTLAVVLERPGAAPGAAEP